MLGDATPNYFWDHSGWSRVPVNYENSSEPTILLPHTLYFMNRYSKMIVLMRNPTDRYHILTPTLI